MNHGEPTNLSTQPGDSQGEAALTSVFKQQCRHAGEDLARVKVQKMGKGKGFGPRGQCQ